MRRAPAPYTDVLIRLRRAELVAAELKRLEVAPEVVCAEIARAYELGADQAAAIVRGGRASVDAVQQPVPGAGRRRTPKSAADPNAPGAARTRR